MADTRSVLKSVRERIAKLAQLAEAGDADAAKKLAAELTREIESALEEKPAQTSKRPAPKAPRDEVVKCPRCTLRSFTFQKGTVREMDDGSGGYEARFHCTSCGHEDWRGIS